jgi:hypothetical protein
MFDEKRRLRSHKRAGGSKIVLVTGLLRGLLRRYGLLAEGVTNVTVSSCVVNGIGQDGILITGECCDPFSPHLW